VPRAAARAILLSGFRAEGSLRSKKLLRKIIAALLLVPLAVVIVAFAVANRQSVTLALDPFGASAPAASLSLPLFALVIATLIVGAIAGGVAAWLGQGKWRRRARRQESEANELRVKLAAFAQPPEPSLVPRESTPPPRLKLRPPAG
jgi:uncharacterized integral membrane protein